MRVVGLDLSLTSTGVAVVDDDPERTVPMVTVRRITSSGKATATLAERRERLQLLTAKVVDAAWPCDLALIEGPSFGQHRQGGQHDRAGLWWLVVNALRGCDVPVVEAPPSVRAKYATGAGNASKDAVLAAVVRRYPDVDVRGNDEADALVLAAMGARFLGNPIDALPQVHLAAMGKVHWPAVERADGAP